MTKLRLAVVGTLAMVGMAAASALTSAQQTPAAPRDAVAGARAGSAVSARLAVCAAARLQDRAGDAGRSHRVVDRRHVRCAGPSGRVAEQSGNGVSPRASARQQQRRDLRDREDRRGAVQHVSRLVLREPDDALRELPRQPAWRSAARTGSRRWRRWRRRTRGSAAGRGCAGARAGRAGQAPAPTATPPAPPRPGDTPPANPGISGLYKLEDTNGDDVMDKIERIHRYTSAGMGDHGSHAVRRAPDGSITFLIGNNTYVGAPPVNDDVVDKEASPNWNNVKERQFLPQYNDPRFGNSTRIGVHATVWRLQPEQQVGVAVQRHAQSVRLRLQPRGRGVHVGQRHGMGRELAVVSRGADDSHDSRAATAATATAPASSRTSTST